MSVLVRVQGPDAPSDGEGEGVRRFDVALARGLIGPGAQEFLRVVEVCEVGNFPLAEGALLKGSIRVDSHHWKRELFGSSVWLGRLPLDGDVPENFFSFPLGAFHKKMWIPKKTPQQPSISVEMSNVKMSFFMGEMWSTSESLSRSGWPWAPLCTPLHPNPCGAVRCYAHPQHILGIPASSCTETRGVTAQKPRLNIRYKVSRRGA